MKKFLLAVGLGSMLFAANSADIDKKLDLILQQIQQLKKEVKSKDKEIEQLKQQLNQQQQEIKKQEIKTKNEFAIKDCRKIKVVSLHYTYHGDVIPYYDLTFTIKNEYPKTIVYLNGNLYAEDQDGVKILKAYVDRKVTLKPGESITIHKKHTINGEIEKYLKDENPQNLRIYFVVTHARFSDGTELSCGLF